MSKLLIPDADTDLDRLRDDDIVSVESEVLAELADAQKHLQVGDEIVVLVNKKFILAAYDTDFLTAWWKW